MNASHDPGSIVKSAAAFTLPRRPAVLRVPIGRGVIVARLGLVEELDGGHHV